MANGGRDKVEAELKFRMWKAIIVNGIIFFPFQ